MALKASVEAPGEADRRPIRRANRMNRPRLIRGLRIAWSVWWGILCVLLIVLWVRSRSKYELMEGPISKEQTACVSSIPGRLDLTVYKNPKRPSRKWTLASYDMDQQTAAGLPEYRDLGFAVHSARNGWGFHVPYWFLIVIGAAVAGAPWLIRSDRFSLRTLLIATTLIALVLATAACLRLW